MRTSVLKSRQKERSWLRDFNDMKHMSNFMGLVLGSSWDIMIDILPLRVWFVATQRRLSERFWNPQTTESSKSNEATVIPTYCDRREVRPWYVLAPQSSHLSLALFTEALLILGNFFFPSPFLGGSVTIYSTQMILLYSHLCWSMSVANSSFE